MDKGQWEQEGGSHKFRLRFGAAFSVFFSLQDSFSQNSGEKKGNQIITDLIEKDFLWNVLRGLWDWVKFTRGRGKRRAQGRTSVRKNEKCFTKHKSKFPMEIRKMIPNPVSDDLFVISNWSALFNSSYTSGSALILEIKTEGLTRRKTKR